MNYKPKLVNYKELPCVSTLVEIVGVSSFVDTENSSVFQSWIADLGIGKSHYFEGFLGMYKNKCKHIWISYPSRCFSGCQQSKPGKWETNALLRKIGKLLQLLRL